VILNFIICLPWPQSGLSPGSVTLSSPIRPSASCVRGRTLLCQGAAVCSGPAEWEDTDGTAVHLPLSLPTLCGQLIVHRLPLPTIFLPALCGEGE
jgi:hypothetical protein